jgi:hypothetical protein
MDAHLTKPLSRGKLLRTLADVIAAHEWLSHASAGITVQGASHQVVA